MDEPSPVGQTMLEEIPTRWSEVSDPLQFVLRYALAVQRYLSVLVKNEHDAEDVAQGFLLRVVSRPFSQEFLRGGRFRDYLKAALRNEALTHFRRRSRRPTEAADLDHYPAPDTERAAEQEWLAGWRNCLLQRAWEHLERHEREAPDGLAYTVLRLAVDHPEEDSTALAARAAAASGRALRAEAFRKQLSRARRHFAQYLVQAVRQTLESPRVEDILEELTVLGLMEYVRDFLPDSLRGRGT